jgi:hypothetical protein
MSDAQLSLWAIAIAVGFSSAWRNPTALALVLAFAVSQLGLPHDYYVFPDVFTIFIIALKVVLPREAVCSAADRFILFSLPLSWIIYVSENTIPHFYWWWSLTIIAFAQFLAAGMEPFFHKSIRRDADAVNRPPVRPGPLLFVYSGGGRLGW